MSSAQQFAWLKEHHPEVFARVAAARAVRAVRAGRRDVGRVRHQPARRRGAGPPVRPRQALLPGASSASTPRRCGCPTRSATRPRCRSWSRLSGVALVPDPEDLLEPDQPLPAPHASGGRASTAPGCSPTSRRSTPTTPSCPGASWRTPCATSATRARRPARWCPFGYGDGGGGPTREMLARARRTADLEGSPRVTIEPPDGVLRRGRGRVPRDGAGLGRRAVPGAAPRHVHLAGGDEAGQPAQRAPAARGRAVVRDRGRADGQPTYPYDELDRIWKTVLLHQFHDILPGLVDRLGAPRGRGDLRAGGGGAERADRRGAAARWPATAARGRDFNAARTPAAACPALGAATAVGAGRGRPGRRTARPRQRPAAGRRRRARAAHLGVRPGRRPRGARARPRRATCCSCIPTCRTAGTPGTSTPSTATGSATWPTSAEVAVEDGAIRGDPRGSAPPPSCRRSRLRRRAARRLARSTVDWHEREKFLKVAFPLDVHADRAAFETQFGHVHRATHDEHHRGTRPGSRCARTAGCTSASPGTASRSSTTPTYGHDVRRRATRRRHDRARLSLLRAPRFPDPETDQGSHTFRYALVPGAGIADAIRAGYRLNLPAAGRRRRRPGRAAGDRSTATRAVVVEAVKLADDRSGDVVVRLYESHGGRAPRRSRPTSRSPPSPRPTCSNARSPTAAARSACARSRSSRSGSPAASLEPWQS